MPFIPHVAVKPAAARQRAPRKPGSGEAPAGPVLALVSAIAVAALAAGALSGVHGDDAVGAVFLGPASAGAGFAIGRAIGRDVQ